MQNYVMRQYVRDAYPGDTWKRKVDKMSDNQILAIYRRMTLDSKNKKG